MNMKLLKFKESKLNLQELDKISNGEKRGDILIKKINSDEDIKIDQSKSIIIQNKEEIISSISDEDGYNSEKSKDFFSKPNRRYKDVIKSIDGETYKLNDIEKTTDFGSNKGSNLGSEQTRHVESLQCLYLSYRQFLQRDLEYSDALNIIYEDDRKFDIIKKCVETEVDITKDLISKYVDKWKYTFTKTANSIFNCGEVNSGFAGSYLLDKSKTYKFCQFSSKKGIVLNLKEAYSRCQVGISMFKWNPSDIWIIDINSQVKIRAYLEKYVGRDIKRLNSVIDSEFDKKRLIGLSLKKVSKDEDIKIIINKITKPPRYKFHSIKVSIDPFNSIGLKIIANRIATKDFMSGVETMTVRSFSGPNVIQNISAEVDGKMAKHGKISLTRINKILQFYGVDPVLVAKSKNEEYYEDTIESISNEDLMEEINEINDKIISKYGDISISKNSYTKEMTRAKLISKYQSLFLAWILMENQDVSSEVKGLSISDRIVEDMFRYALSIYTDIGRTPKYVRIVD